MWDFFKDLISPVIASLNFIREQAERYFLAVASVFLAVFFAPLNWLLDTTQGMVSGGSNFITSIANKLEALNFGRVEAYMTAAMSFFQIADNFFPVTLFFSLFTGLLALWIAVQMARLSFWIGGKIVSFFT